MLSDKLKPDSSKITASSGAVSLQQILDARERRVARQQHCLQQFKCPLISASLVIPGANKRSQNSKVIADALQRSLQQLIERLQWPVLFNDCFDLQTGYEQLLGIDLPALAIKQQLCQLEQQHPLGRLWDLDVIDIDGQIISRSQLGLPPRQCLLCSQSAHICARVRQHSIVELETLIGQKVKHYAGQ